MATDPQGERVAKMVGLFTAWLDVVPTEWSVYRLGTGSEEYATREREAEDLAQQMQDLRTQRPGNQPGPHFS